MQRARDDIRVVRLREEMLRAIQGAVELWSRDAEVSEVKRFFISGSSDYSLKNDTGAQRPVQVDNGARGRRNAHLVAAWPVTGTRMSSGAVSAYGGLACPCEYAYHTT